MSYAIVHLEQPYLNLLRHVAAYGTRRADRTGTGTRSVFGHQLRFPLDEAFPLITTKRIHIRSVIGELLWFLSGSSNVGWLQDNGIGIWNEWAGPDGELGPIYGVQWRSWPAADGATIDQIAGALDLIRNDPESRRIVVSAWNVAALDKMALPPCHVLFQFYVSEGRLSCQLYQRSADLFLGVPFNIASYSLLTAMLAQQADLELGEFIWTGGDCHIYDNHLPQVETQLARAPLASPHLRLNRADSLFDYTFDDIKFSDYIHHPSLPAAVAV